MACVVCCHISLVGQTVQETTNRMVEVTLISSRLYEHPQQDVALSCRLSGPRGITMNVGGFWDGDSTYRVRFALLAEGVWDYSITCSDTDNTRLHGVRGQVHVKKYNGPNPFYSKGWLKVSSNGRYLTYGDAEPFFYLGDTAWELAWKSREPEVLAYLADRKRKGFNALQIVVMSHQFFYKNGVRNRYGADFFLNDDRSRPNPRYFDYLDRIVQAANDSGFVIALAPLWAGMMEYYASKTGSNTLTAAQALQLARYVGARYAGSNVIWIIGGDNEYESTEKRNFWSQFALTLKEASGNHHLATVHPKAYRASFDFFDKWETWLDFHMYQSSHVAGGDFTWKAGLRGYYEKNTKPLLNGEATYEDIPSNLWQPGDTSHVQTSRIQAVDVRQASYESLLSGAHVGITYGANGIWQWNTPELPGTHLPRYAAVEAEAFPGSSHMTILKDVMLKIPWINAVPSQNLVVDFSSQENFIPIASTDDRIITYFPHHTEWIALRTFPQARFSRYYWINPSTGDSSESRQIVGPLRFTPPDTSDWLLIIQKPLLQRQSDLRARTVFLLEQNYPNPFSAEGGSASGGNPKTIIRYHLPKDTRVTLKVYTLLGVEVATLIDDEHAAGSYSVEFDGSHLPSGVYFYRIASPAFADTKKFILVQ